jgi:hypothetical protein
MAAKWMKINPSYKGLAESQGLVTFENFMSFEQGTLVSSANDATVRHLSIRYRGRRNHLYIRHYRYKPDGLWDRLGTNYARRYFANSETLRILGIATPEIVAAGERRAPRIPHVSGFVIVRALSHMSSLLHYLPRLFTESSGRELRREKLALIAALAQVVRRMHDGGFVHIDLALKNVLVRRRADEYELAVAESPRGRRVSAPWRLRRGVRRDLALLDFTARRFVSRTDRLRFYVCYKGSRKLTRRDRSKIHKIAEVSAGQARKRTAGGSVRITTLNPGRVA